MIVTMRRQHDYPPAGMTAPLKAVRLHDGKVELYS